MMNIFMSLTEEPKLIVYKMTYLSVELKKCPCVLYYLEVLEVVTAAYLAVFLWFYCLSVNILKNCTMHKGNGSRVWDISCIKNESGYFIDWKATFFVQQIHFFPHPRNFDFEK